MFTVILILFIINRIYDTKVYNKIILKKMLYVKINLNFFDNIKTRLTDGSC